MSSKNKNKTQKIYKNENKHTLEILIGDLKFKPKNEKQQSFCDLIEEKEIVICSGPAGVGKSMLSILKALELLKSPNNEFYKIIICKPAVPADEDIGFLPGNIAEKLDPFLYSTFYLFEKILGKTVTKSLIDQGYLQILGLGYMRGINIDNSLVIFEEIQNATPKQVKTLLTRIGYKSKFIVSGDLEQSDKYKNSHDSGLYDAMNRVVGIDDIGLFKFDESDIVRNKIISKILEKYKD